MLPNIILACVLTALGGYLLGSILFGVLISKVMYNDDVRDHGSGNAGMTNVLRTYGKLPAVFTTIGDVGKSVAAVNLGRFIFDALLSGTGAAWQNPLDPVCGAYLAAIFCMIGHSRPIFFGFKGGKGVLVGAGAALATEPLVCAALLVIFLIEVAITRIVSLGSIIIAALYPVGTLTHLIACGANLPTIVFSTVCCAIMAAMVIWLHRSNIERLNVRQTPFDNILNAAIKRGLDIIGSLVLIVLTSPVMLVTAIGVKLSSPGPIIFKQERIGLNKKPFMMYKFRSMRVNVQQETGWSKDYDPRKTHFGSFIRKFSLDELPQFFNVLKGDMSLVGPRPEVPFHVEHFKEEIPRYLVRQQVRPGCTGWAQIHGLRGDTDIAERIRYDIWYIENWTVALDIKIIFRTVFGGKMVNDEKLQ